MLSGPNEYRLKLNDAMKINAELTGFSTAAIPITAHPRYININYREEALNTLKS